MANEQKFLEWTYPVAGIDRQEEFQEQPALTTPVAKNVRAFEPSSDRGRGGSRPGIAKYIADQLPSGSNVIQHLKQIVDPQGPLTGLSFGPEDVTTLDTSDGGRAILDDGSTRVIRLGGSGFYTHPENESNAAPASEFDQSASDSALSDAGQTKQFDIPFDADVSEDDLILVFVDAGTSGGTVPDPTVTDSQGNSYTLGANHVITASHKFNMYWAIASQDGPCTVTVVADFTNGTGFPGTAVAILNYRNTALSDVVDDVATNTGTVNNDTAWTCSTGPVEVNGDNETVLMAYFGGFSNGVQEFTRDPQPDTHDDQDLDWQLREAVSLGPSSRLLVYDAIGFNSPAILSGDLEPELDVTSPNVTNTAWYAVGVSIKRF